MERRDQRSKEEDETEWEELHYPSFHSLEGQIENAGREEEKKKYRVD